MSFPSKEKKGKLVRPLPSNDHRGITNPLGFTKSVPQRDMELSLGSPFASASPPGGKGQTWPKYKATYIPSYSGKGKGPGEQTHKPGFDFGDGKNIPSYSGKGPDEQIYKPNFDFGDGKGPDKQTSYGLWDGNCIPSYSVEGPDEQTSTSPKYKKPTFTACKPSFEVRQNIPLSYITTRKEEVEPPGHVFCSKCCTAHHPRSSYCPVLPCKTCFNPHHTFPSCPYFTLIPKGAVFDRVNYEIICGCGNMFNEDKWDCSRCNGRPKLQSKYCVICFQYAQHSSHECPKDKVLAAHFKAIRDKNFSRKCIPYVGYPSVS